MGAPPTKKAPAFSNAEVLTSGKRGFPYLCYTYEQSPRKPSTCRGLGALERSEPVRITASYFRIARQKWRFLPLFPLSFFASGDGFSQRAHTTRHTADQAGIDDSSSIHTLLPAAPHQEAPPPYRREGHRFSRPILPRYIRRSPSIDRLIPALYLKEAFYRRSEEHIREAVLN